MPSSDQKSGDGWRVATGVFAVGLVLSAVIAFAVPFELPRLWPRQVGDESFTSYDALRPSCTEDRIKALPVAEQAATREACETDREAYRIDKESLGQAVRATDANEEMVRVGFQQTRIAFAQALLTTFALVFTGWAAWAASRAARAAERSSAQAHDQMKIEQQAYVHVDRAELKWGNSGGTRPQIILWVKNTGQTPARWFGAQARLVTSPDDEKITKAIFDAAHMEDVDWFSWPSLGGQGGELSFSGRRKADVGVAEGALERQEILHVLGTIRYETIFGEVFETEFWFTRRPEHRYVDQPPPEGVHSGLSAVEVGQPMQRPSYTLKTYSPVRTDHGIKG